jgi:hypothetical protein
MLLYMKGIINSVVFGKAAYMIYAESRRSPVRSVTIQTRRA